MRRRRMMACTTSIGPGATNMAAACALAHVNRLPVLLIPGDVFASRRPDPVLQQVEGLGGGTVTASDCFRPVSRHFDRIAPPEQLMPALERAMAVLTDPAECGPATLSFRQDAQAEAHDDPARFFEPRLRRARRPPPDAGELEAAATQVIVIDTDAGSSTDAGGFWWDVAVPEVSARPEVARPADPTRGGAACSAP